MTRQDLSRAEREVFDLMIMGVSNQDAADKLCVTEKTIKFHITHIFKKFNVKSRHALLVYHYQAIILDLETKLEAMRVENGKAR